MKYFASVIVDGWIEVEVDARSEEEARVLINEEVACTDFGELRDVAWQFQICKGE